MFAGSFFLNNKNGYDKKTIIPVGFNNIVFNRSFTKPR